MKKLISMICGIILLGFVSQASAITLSLLPAVQTVAPGDTVSLDLVIDGLGDFAPDSLGTFDIDIAFDSTALSFIGYSLGTFLGDELFGEAWDLSLGDSGGGIINLAELSLLDADPSSGPAGFGPFLDDIQPGSFTLATLDFTVDVLAPGSSTIVSFDTVWALGDGFGNPLTLDSTSDALINARSSSVPEPTTLALLSLGLFGIGAARKSQSKR